jgi:hypothetical protein
LPPGRLPQASPDSERLLIRFLLGYKESPFSLDLSRHFPQSALAVALAFSSRLACLGARIAASRSAAGLSVVPAPSRCRARLARSLEESRKLATLNVQ